MNEEQMKSYHLTQEQALEIASNLELDEGDIAVWTNGYVEFETKEALQIFVNTVLDKVLGDPVGEITENILWGKDVRWSDDLPIIGTKLYAPKEQS